MTNSMFTVGAIAGRLNKPVHVIEHLLRTRNIPPAGRAGRYRVFNEDAVGRIAQELRAIDARKGGAR